MYDFHKVKNENDAHKLLTGSVTVDAKVGL